MAMYRGAFPVITTRAGLNMVYFQQYAQHRELYSAIFNSKTSTRGYEDFVKISGIGRLREMGEGEKLTYDEAVEGDRVTAAHTMYGLGFQISRLLWDDDQYGIMERMSEALARSVRYEQEVQAFGLLNDAFAGATFTGFDGLSLCNDSHTLLNSTSTYDNALASDLAVSSLEAAIDMFALAVDEQDMYITIEPRVLLVPAQGRWLAATILESEYDPENDNNAINPLRDVGLSWMASPFITDTDSFYVLSDKSNHDLTFFWRLKPETDDTEDFDTKGLKFSSIQRFLVHFNEWRGVVGSAGAP